MRRSLILLIAALTCVLLSTVHLFADPFVPASFEKGAVEVPAPPSVGMGWQELVRCALASAQLTYTFVIGSAVTGGLILGMAGAAVVAISCL